MMESHVSVIIPFTTFDNYVLESITYCLSMNYSNFNIILLPDDKISLPRILKKNDKIKIIIIGSKKISEKRNIGLKNNPNSNFYAFIDSDAYPDRNWLKKRLKCFKTIS